jgi:hypothetical protein
MPLAPTLRASIEQQKQRKSSRQLMQVFIPSPRQLGRRSSLRGKRRGETTILPGQHHKFMMDFLCTHMQPNNVLSRYAI